jgi:hypothetical protein
MTIRCLFGHDEGGFLSGAETGKFGARRCHRCHQAIGGVTLGPKPRPVFAGDPTRVAIPQTPISRIWWLRGVFEKPAAS